MILHNLVKCSPLLNCYVSVIEQNNTHDLKGIDQLV